MAICSSYSRVTRCPVLCGTAQHFHPLSHVMHIETMSCILDISRFVCIVKKATVKLMFFGPSF